MSKNIWFINEYAGSPYYGMEFRHYYIGKELVKVGYEVAIVSSSYSHLFKKTPKKRKENIDGINYLWIKTFNYGTAHNKKRILKWFIFMLKIFLLPFILKKPDFIVVSPMAPFPILPAWVLSKILGAKLIYEVKDIWPLSLVELGGINPKNPLIYIMSLCERFAIKKSDVIVSTLKNYGEHLTKDLLINKEFVWINNGIYLDEMKNKEPLSKNIEDKIPKNKFIVGYTGTIGTSNDMETLCKAAKLLKNREDILFVIVGNGKDKQNLLDTYSNLDNIVFIEPIKKAQVQSMLDRFDICYIGWKKDKLYNYGISPNKIFDYMYSAKPILHAYSGKGDIIEIANAGLTVEAENPNQIAEGVLNFYNMPIENRVNLGKNAKSYILEHFTYEKLARKYKEIL